MRLEAGSIPAGSVLATDVCIVGGGPVGLSIASELADTGHRILLVESGGLQITGATQALNKGTTVGRPYMRLDRARFRALGGNSHRWFRSESAWAADGGLRCLPLRPIDFEIRDGIANSGWPIGSADLDAGYKRARELCGLTPAEEAQKPFELDESLIEPVVFDFGPDDQFRKLGQKLIDSREVEIALNATAVAIDTESEGERISQIRIARPDGSRFAVTARLFVLAGGGIENARLLLASDQPHPGGLGNGSGLVGRFFMEHLHTTLGLLRPSSPITLTDAGFYDRRPAANGAAKLGAFALSERVMREEGLLGVVISPFLTYDRLFTREFAAFMRLRQALIDRALTRVAARDAVAALGKAPSIVQAAWMTRTHRFPRSRAAFGLVVQAEQAPDPNSRVTLSDKRDRFGVRQTRLDWRWGEMELRSILRAQSVLNAALQRRGIGRIESWFKGREDADKLTGAWHHMGTTRMHPDPAKGVVDRDCRVHGTANLYVAGSSVFPTSGAATVTLTSIALAVRLARHLSARLEAQPQVSPNGAPPGKAGVEDPAPDLA